MVGNQRVWTRNKNKIANKYSSNLIFFWFLVILTIAVLWLFSIYFHSQSVFYSFICFGILGYVIIHRLDKNILRLFGIIYCISVLVSLFIFFVYSNIYANPYYIGGSDDLQYELAGKKVADQLSIWDYGSIRGGIVDPSNDSVGYIYLISLLYRFGDFLGGFHTMIPKIFNGMVLGLISVLTYLISKNNKIPTYFAYTTALFVGLLPIMTFTAAHTFRDITVSLICLWVIYQWDSVINYVEKKRKIILVWLWSILAIIILFEFRQSQAICLFLICIFCDFTAQKNPIVKNRPFIFFRVLFLGGMLGLAIWHFGSNWIVDRVTFYYQYYTNYNLSNSLGLSNIVFSASLPISFMLRAFYGLISPLPFIGKDFGSIFMGFGTFLQFFYLPYLGLGLYNCIKKAKSFHLIIAFLLFYSMSLFTFTFRHIVVLLPYAILLSMYGFISYKKYKTGLLFLMLFIGSFLIVIYLLLKG